MILVTGASGHLGQLVVQQLVQKVPAGQVVAGVRDPGKATALAALGVQVRALDYTKPETIAAALAGVDRVLLISSNQVGQRLVQHQAVIEAATQAGVKLLAYTSILHADTTRMALAGEHKATEEAIKASGVPYVFLRNGWYTENYTDNLAPALEHGAMLGSAGEGKVAPASRADYAAAAVAVLTGAGHENKVYELAGDRAVTLTELAAEVARLSGKPVIYKDLPEAEYAGFLASVGLPKAFADILANSDVGITRGELNDTSGDLHRLIGRATTPIQDTIAAALER